MNDVLPCLEFRSASRTGPGWQDRLGTRFVNVACNKMGIAMNDSVAEAKLRVDDLERFENAYLISFVGPKLQLQMMARDYGTPPLSRACWPDRQLATSPPIGPPNTTYSTSKLRAPGSVG